jgi:hypothetical protein
VVAVLVVFPAAAPAAAGIMMAEQAEERKARQLVTSLQLLHKVIHMVI